MENIISSCIYRGTVRHNRLRPKKNAFKYGAYFLYLDIDKLDYLDRSLKFFSHNRFNIFYFTERDHGARNRTSLRRYIENLLEQVNINIEGGQIMLLSFPRAFGFRFFPVSFWYCFHRDGSLMAIMAEVNNTFRQHHNYLLHKSGQQLNWGEKLQAQKIFHVSPFIQMEDVYYQFEFSEPSDNLKVKISEPVEGQTLLIARVDLKRRELRDSEILRTMLRFGPMSARALSFIYWQAIKIMAKGIKYIPKPELPEKETSL